MTAQLLQPHEAAPPAGGIAAGALHLLTTASRMLLEYNVRASTLRTQTRRLAERLGIDVEISMAYLGATLYPAGGPPVRLQVHEYRLNADRASGTLRIIDQFCGGGVSVDAAIERLEALGRSRPCHSNWSLALIFGLAAAALACILHADWVSAVASAVSSAIGLLVRRELARRHWPLLMLPFVAGLIGGVVSGFVIRMGWTYTPGLCLMIPALMLVPGPHLINGVFDLFDNFIQTGTCRLVLAAGILVAAAAGTLLGGWLTIRLEDLTDATSHAIELTLWLDVILAGIAACGFGAFYNAPWRLLVVSIACGMVGHGVRFVCLAEGMGLPTATLLACIAIGFMANAAVYRFKLSFSSTAFAGAVPMMPGALIYRSLANALALSAAGNKADPGQMTTTLVLLEQAALVVGGMAVGLLLGAFVASFFERAFHKQRVRATSGTAGI